MLEKERAYFESNLSVLQQNYMGKYVVISGDQVIGPYESDEDAYSGAMEAKYPLGSFMIKHITDDLDDQIQRFTGFVYV